MNIKRIGAIAALATALSITGAGIADAAASHGRPHPSPSADDKTTTITGKLLSGVENGCTLLRTESGTEYQLFTDDPNVHLPENGDAQSGTVTYIGQIAKDTVSYCGQGTPFRVVKVTTS